MAWSSHLKTDLLSTGPGLGILSDQYSSLIHSLILSIYEIEHIVLSERGDNLEVPCSPAEHGQFLAEPLVEG